MKVKKLIDAALVEALIQYLSSRPWNEVQQAMPALMNLPDAPQLESLNDKSADARPTA